VHNLDAAGRSAIDTTAAVGGFVQQRQFQETADKVRRGSLSRGGRGAVFTRVPPMFVFVWDSQL
jgi:hypothetical protein